jgi:hypothetical protein
MGTGILRKRLKDLLVMSFGSKGQKNARVNRTAFNWTRTLETLLTLIVNSRKKYHVRE